MNTQVLAQFLNFLWGSLKAIHTLVFGFISLAIIVAILVAVGSQKKAEVPDGGALVLNPRGVLVEQKTAIDPASVLQIRDLPKESLVKDIIDALALARDDERIGLLVLHLDGLDGGLLPKLERIATAISDFKTSGKKVIAIGNNYNQSAIYLAVHADEVLLNPEGSALAEGFGMYRTYYKTLLDNFEVSVNLFKVGKYKSATEPFIRDSMSEEDKEARLGILDSWWDAYTGAVQSARGLPDGSIDGFLDDAPDKIRQVNGDLAQMAVEMGIVDRLLTADEGRAYLIELAGEDEKSNEYKRISYGQYLTVARNPELSEDNKIAVITAVGTIIDGKARAGGIGSSSLTKLIRRVKKDEQARAIVLRVDSGGGSKTASEIIRRELENLQDSGIPVVVSMGSVAASGGYWISATADEIWASPTTITGSIGIFGLIPTFEKTLARYGIHSDGVGTTPVTGGASIDRGVSPVYGEIIQLVIDAGYQQFLAVVSRGRNMSTDAVHEIAQGRVWTGEAALDLGLVDHLGDLEQAIEAASRLAKIDDYSIWYVEPELSTREELLRTLMSEVSVVLPESGLNPGALLMNKIKQDLNFLTQLNDPRGAYVICGSCPLNP